LNTIAAKEEGVCAEKPKLMHLELRFI